MAKSIYEPKTKNLPEQVEALISQCYPAIQEQVDRMSVKFFQNARAHGHRHVTPAVAREVVLMLILRSAGSILE